MPLLLATIALLGIAVAAWIVLWRRYRVQRYYHRVSQRIRDRFPALDEPLGDGLPLHAPPGEVSVRSDGLHLHLEEKGFGHCRVPWSDVHHVVPTGRGSVLVHISGVGDVSVPSSAGRQLWTSIHEARAVRQAKLVGNGAEAGRV